MSSSDIERLSSLCRGEISAVEAYGQVLHADVSSRCAKRLRDCQTSHQTRVDLLRMQIGLLGGDAPSKAGPWGTFASAVEKLAAAAGAKLALAMLDEGEAHGLRRYRAQAHALDASSNALLNKRLLPLQLETRRIVRDLRHNAP